MRLILGALAGLLAACTPPTADTPPVTSVVVEARAEAVNNCPAEAHTTWDGGGGVTFRIEASTMGGSCADATATITIFDAAGAVAHTNSVPVRNSQALAEAESPQDMERRLAEWISPAGASMDSVGDLAAWEPGAPEPSYAGVPFAPRVSREIYAALRAGDGPMYCYERDLAAGICLTVWDGVLEEVGAQSYAQ